LVRRALSTDSVVDRFLQLYRILLDKCGSQTKTDNWLKKTFGDTLKPRPGGSKKQKLEPEFTRVRNDYAHVRHGSSLESTRGEMERLMPDLIERVKKAIETR
jgi:hypothetical protein